MRCIPKPKKAFWLLVFLFLAATAIWFHFADYLRTIIVYADELRYYMIAEDIATGRPFSLYNAPWAEQKILYSLVISPAFLVADRALTMRIIAMINSILLVSGIFPVYWLSKKITDSTKIAAFCSVFYLLLPDFDFTMYVMSEPLYIPLTLVVLCGYYILCTERQPTVRRCVTASLLTGFGTYLLYLTKEIALAAPLAYGGVLLYFLLREKSLKALKMQFLALGGLAAGFAVPFVLMKLTVFSGMPASVYGGMTGLYILLMDGRLFYLFYGAFYYLFNAILAFGVFPVILPLLFFKSMSEKNRSFYLYLASFLVVMAFVVSYTIYIRESSFQLVPVTALRYTCYLAMPFFFYLFASLKDAIPRKKAVLFIISSVIAAILFQFYHGVLYTGVWGAMLYYMDVAFTHFAPWLIRICLILLFALFLLLLWWNKKAFLILFCTAFTVLQCYNTVKAVQAAHAHTGTLTYPDAYEDFADLRIFMEQHPDENFLYCSERGEVTTSSFVSMDTFAYTANVRYLDRSTVNGLAKNGSIDLTGNPELPTFLYATYYDHDLYVNYVILPNEFYMEPACADLVGVYKDAGFSVYHLKEANHLLPIPQWHEKVGGSLKLAAGPISFVSLCESTGSRFISGAEPSTLLSGPNIPCTQNVSAGKYTVTVHYDTSRCHSTADAVIGAVGVFGTAIDPTAYLVNFTPETHSVTVEDIDVPDVSNLLVQVYSYTSGLQVESVEITRVA